MLEGAHDGPLVWGSSFRHWLTCSPICVPVKLRWGVRVQCIMWPRAPDLYTAVWCIFDIFHVVLVFTFHKHQAYKRENIPFKYPQKCAKFQAIFYWFKCFSFNVRLISDLQVWVNWYIEFYHAVGILPVLYLGHLQWTTIITFLDLLDWMISHIFIESLSPSSA